MSQKCRLAAPRNRHFARWSHVFYCRPDWWLIVELRLEGWVTVPTAHSPVQRLSFLRAPNERPDLLAIWNRRRHVASRHLPTTDNWQLYLLRQDRSLDVKVGQIIECQGWLKWGLMCTTCYPYVINTSWPQ